MNSEFRLENTNERSEKIRELLSDIPRSIKIGSYCVLALVLAIIIIVSYFLFKYFPKSIS